MEEQEEKKTVELPALDFLKINMLSVIVPLYICLGLFLLFEYFFIIAFSIPLIFHLLLLPGVFLLLYYIYLMILIEFSAFWAKSWYKKSPPKEGVFERVLDDVKREESRTGAGFFYSLHRHNCISIKAEFKFYRNDCSGFKKSRFCMPFGF